MPFSTEVAWTRLNPEHPISNTISVRLNKTTPPTFPLLDSSMSTSPTPATPPTHSSPSNQTVDPTTSLITLMHQSLWHNASMVAQLHYCPSPPPAPQPSPSYQYKPQRPPFPKWDSTNDPPIPCPDIDVQVRGLLRRSQRLGVHHTGEPATKRRNKLQYAGFTSVIDILDVPK